MVAMSKKNLKLVKNRKKAKKRRKMASVPVHGLTKTELTIRDMLKCLYLLLEGASEQTLGIQQGPIPFSKEQMAEVPDDLMNQIMIAEDEKFLVLTIKQKKEKSNLILPEHLGG